jgi:hypothetical protein
MAGIATEAILVQVTDETLNALEKEGSVVLSFGDGERSLVLERVEARPEQDATPDRTDTIGVQ